jgi:GTP-binding protein
MLIDRARIHVKAGNGGNGSSSFRREKYVPRGGPDGGDGGRGGDVVLRVKANLSSLLPFQYNQQFAAEAGGNGMKRQKQGKAGSRLYVDVPPGTVVTDDETGEVLADLTEANEEVVIARGGRGGLGNVHFKSSTRQAPKLAELGEPGEERSLRLELRLIADVGLVGLPNAGKSTLLGAASAARPKIADYPFTTVEPNLGVVEVGGPGGQTFVLADIPGLIEGAAEGSGLGHEFLRHVTRTRVLVHVLDASGGLEGRDPLSDFRTVNAELAAYDEALAAKPMLVALNKTDLAEARERAATLRSALEGESFRVHDVSAATGAGVVSLMNDVAATLREVVAREREEEKPQERRRYTLADVDERAWEVDRLSAHHFAVRGIGIERFTKMTNFGNDDAVRRFQQVLEKSGIADELARQGIGAADVVHIADHELVWGEDQQAEPAQAAGRRRSAAR